MTLCCHQTCFQASWSLRHPVHDVFGLITHVIQSVVTLNVFSVNIFFFFFRYDRKWVGERDGGWERERSTRRDSISGHPKGNHAICRCGSRRLSAPTFLSLLNCKYRRKVSLSELNITPHLWKLVSATILKKVKKIIIFFSFYHNCKFISHKYEFFSLVFFHRLKIERYTFLNLLFCGGNTYTVYIYLYINWRPSIPKNNFV